MSIKLNKKGSHVGLVVSFLIFIVFISFLRIILQPALTLNEEKKVILEDVEKELVRSASEEVTSTSVHLNGAVSEECITLNGFMNDFGFEPNMVVKNKEGGIVQSSLSPGNSNNLQIARNDISHNYFKIYYSDGFEETLSQSIPSCHLLSEGSGYTLGATMKENYLFEDLLLELIDSYSALPKFQLSKDSPASVNIGISFSYENGTEVKTRDRNVTTDIFVKESPIEYVDKNGNILPGKLAVKVW